MESSKAILLWEDRLYFVQIYVIHDGMEYYMFQDLMANTS